MPRRILHVVNGYYGSFKGGLSHGHISAWQGFHILNPLFFFYTPIEGIKNSQYYRLEESPKHLMVACSQIILHLYKIKN